MDTNNLNKLVIAQMIDNSIHNNIMKYSLPNATLQLNPHETTSIMVKAQDGNTYYLTHVPDELKVSGQEAINLHGNLRNNLAKKFLSMYKYEDILKLTKEYIDGVNKKIQKANDTKHILQKVCDYILSHNIKDTSVELRRNEHLVKYYVEFELEYNNKLEIYLSDKKDDRFIVRHNYEYMNKEFDYNQLMQLLSSFMNEKIASNNKKQQEMQQRHEQQLNAQAKDAMLTEFVKTIWTQNIPTVLKLKSGYQCVHRGIRYSVGTNKAGKFYKLQSMHHLKEFIKSKDISSYVFLTPEQETVTFTDEVLKQLPYKIIYE